LLNNTVGLWNNPSEMSRTLVLLAAVAFGTTGTARALGPDASPVAVGAARVAVGAALLGLVAWRTAPRSSRPWSRRALLAGALGIAAYQLAFFAAVRDTGVAVGTVVAIGSGPVFAGLLGRGPLTGRWAVSTALATAGVALLVAGGGQADVSIPGVLLALVAGASYGTYTVAAKALLDEGHAPEAVMARAFTAAAVLLAPALVIAGTGWLASPGGAALALYLGAIPTALAYVLFARGLRHISAGEAATLTLAEPLTATALGTVVLGERPGALAALGALLVLSGLVAVAVPARRRQALAAA
jgi:DME family drug/metabolite transporter